ncbi:MAG: hypothetical protein AB7F23_00165 [Phycisphaerae bacterium]|jgi:protein arginine kinase
MNEYDMHHFTVFSSPPEIIKSTLGLRRNVAGYNFRKTLDNAQKRELLDIICKAATDCDEFGNVKTYLPETDEHKMLADLFFENGIIKSRNWKKKSIGRAVLTSSDGSLHLAVNDEDHIRLVTDSNGELAESWQKISALDDKLEAKLGYSFEPQFGYLTTRAGHCGTGLEVSYALHLPLASQSSSMREEIEKIIRKYELTISAGEYNPAFVRVENERYFGLSEEDIIWRTELGVHQIAEVERCAREVYVSKHREELEDMVCKALAVAGCAKLLDCVEAQEIASTLRLGALAGIAGCPQTLKIDVYMAITEPARMKLNLRKENFDCLSALNREVNRLRARLVRVMLEDDSN